MAEGLLIFLTGSVMVVVAALSVLPFIPGPLLLWLIGLVFALVNDFNRLPPLAFTLFTLLTVAGMTTGIWMPLLGMQAQGVSCWGTLGMLVGGLVGTFMIPVPICGTLIGAVLGALLFELVNAGSIDHALQTGRAAMKTFVLEWVANLAITILMVVVFLVSVSATG